ncbi:hypothetical protein Adt_02034 [Abeliophyllum distichum]|uniref:Uncharacterized protein n=1 Tax=Abeliophyllum distichum TaxID=126358 RepID=A0ABD1VV03_9LAMI
MEADLKESDSNLLNLTKQLDNANAAQKVAAEALEAANKDKRRLLEEAESRDEEISGLRKDLAIAEDGRKGGRGRKKGSGSEEVLTVLTNDHPDFDVKNLEARFPPSDAEGEEDS